MLSQADLYRAFDTGPDSIVTFLAWLATEEGLATKPHLADIGAGPGRLIPPLVALGWSVTAYEPDADYFPAVQALAHEYPTVIAKSGGFENVSEAAAFDIACGINSSYAHLLASSRRVEALRRIARALRPGGLLVLDLPNFPWILENYRPAPVQERHWLGTAIRRTRVHEIDRGGGTFTTIDRDELTDFSGTTTSTKTHTYAIVSHEAHASEFASAGFRDVRLFSSFEARVPASSPASRLIYVAH